MKKLFTLLTLLVAIVTGAQAQTASDTYLDLANVASVATAGWSKTAPGHSWDATTQTLVVNGYNAYSSVSKQKWITVNGSGSTTISGGWVASGVFKGSTFWGTTNSASAVNTSRATTFNIKGITAVSVYAQTDNTARQIVLTVKDGDTQVGTVTSNIQTKNATDIITIDNLSTSTTYSITVTGNNSSNARFLEIAFVGQTATETFEVTFDAGSNGTCATSSLTETAPGIGVTLPEVTANTGYGFTGWYIDASDETTKVGDAGDPYKPTEDITLYAGYSELAAPTISVAANKTTAAKNETVTLTATVDGTPNPTIQWYSNTSASTEGGTAIGEASTTNTTYSPSTATPGTYYFYAVATNSQGTATSEVQTITVTASNKCKLSAVTYSNSFKAFITQPSAYKAEDEDVINGNHQVGDPINGKVKAYYMEGTTAPTITGTSVSEGATWAVEGTTLTVTAEDGTTTAVFDITLAAVAPYTGTGTHTFDGNETWVKTGNTFSSNGWKIARSYENDDEGKYMISQGSNRAYLFLGPNASVTITQGGTARSMQAYKNGVAEGNATTGAITVTGDPTAPYMIEITQTASNGGDGAIASINITPSTVSVTVTDAKYATFVPSAAVTFEDADVKGYAAVYNSTKGSAELVEVTAVPAGTPVVVYAAEAREYDLTVVSEATAPAQNNLKVSDGTVEGDMQTIYGLKNGTKGVGFYPVTQNATIAAGKVYLQIPASEGAREFIGFGGEEVVTGIDAIENGTIDNDAPAYNLAGQKVGKGYKGIVIINGKKVVK